MLINIDLILGIFGLSFAVIIIAGMSIFVKKVQPAWSQRGVFSQLDGQWDWIFLLSSATASLTYFYLYTHRNDPLATMSLNVESLPLLVILPMVIAAFVFTLSAWTDAVIHRAPMEIAHLAMALGAVFMFGSAITSGDWSGVISAGLWSIIPAILYMQMGFGDADTRLLWVVTFCIAWWAGWYMTFMMFGIACIIQLVLALCYRWTKWGEVIQLKPSSLIISLRKFWKKINPKSNMKLTREKEDRVVTPLIPALAFSYIFILSFLLVTGNDTLLINGGVGILLT